MSQTLHCHVNRNIGLSGDFRNISLGYVKIVVNFRLVEFYKRNRSALLKIFNELNIFSNKDISLETKFK